MADVSDEELARRIGEAERLHKLSTQGSWYSDAGARPYEKDQPFSEEGASIGSGDGEQAACVVAGGQQDEQGGAVGVLRNEDAESIVALHNVAPALFAAYRELQARRAAEAAQPGEEEVRKYLDEARDKFHVLGCNFSEASPERVCAFGLRDEAASLLERLSRRTA